MTPKLKPFETIVTAWAERAGGPGWANTPIWFIIRDGDGRLRQECLQPEEQTRDMFVLYSASAAVHGGKVRAVADKVTPKRRKAS